MSPSLTVTLEARAPLQHADFVSGAGTGNSLLFRRLTLVGAQDFVRVPAISGNALRNITRRLVMRDLLRWADVGPETCAAIGPHAWDRLYAALANGGTRDGSEATRYDPAGVAALRTALPPLSVYGSALYTWMLAGRMGWGIAWLQCRETADLGLTTGRDGLRVGEEHIEEVGHTRHVDRDQHDPAVTKVTPMPLTMETVMTGSRFESRVDFHPVATEVERAVVAHGLDLVTHVGGKSASGFGRVAVTHTGAAAAYLDWREAHGRPATRDALLALAEACAA